MTVWNLLEYAAWLLSALIAIWLVTDAVRTGQRYDEEFLVHTVEDFGDEAQWQAGIDETAGGAKDGVGR